MRKTSALRAFLEGARSGMQLAEVRASSTPSVISTVRCELAASKGLRLRAHTGRAHRLGSSNDSSLGDAAYGT